MRPTTEWVDTVEAGANVLVDDDPDAIVARRRRRELPAGGARALRRRPRRRARSQPLCTLGDRDRAWDVAIIGAGYVGLPLAQTFAEAGQRVLLVDVVPELVDAINRGESHIEDVASAELAAARRRRPDHRDDRLRASSHRRDAILIALPTPLTTQREPDLTYVESAATRHRAGAPARPGRRARVDDLPGHDARGARSRSSRHGSGLKAGEDFHLAMSPERVDPGRTDWTTKTTPKVVGGITPACTEAAAARLPHARSTPCTRSRRPRRPS